MINFGNYHVGHKLNKNIRLILLLVPLLFLLIYKSPINLSLSIIDALIGIGSGIFIFYFNFLISILLNFYIKEYRILTNQALPNYIKAKTSNVYSLLSLFCSATFEEIIFRSYLLYYFMHYCGLTVAVIVNISIFALIHKSKKKMIQLVLMGLLFVLVTLYTNNILPAIIGHFINNVLVFIKIRKNDKNK